MRALAAVALALVALLPGAATAAPAGCADPGLRAGAPGDATRDAAGRGQIFEQVHVPGITDARIADGTGGVATADVNRDGLPDLLMVGERGALPSSLRLFVNKGCWRFEREALTVLNPEGLPEANHAIPVFADFNGDGLLDFYLTGDPAARGGTHPNMLFLARGDHRTFEEVGRRMGADNALAYSRQAALADVNGDGFVDIGVGADQIGNRTARPGVPWQRLYVYRPAPGSSRFEDGRYEDVGGTDVIPGFGGEPRDDPEDDPSSPTILLRDLDGDRDIDVMQSYHVDMVLTPWFSPSANDERHHGVSVWRNQLADTGEFRFVQDKPGSGGLAEVGWSRYDPLAQRYVPVQHAVSHPYISSADVDNDDDLDILTVGATDLYWHVHTDDVAAKFWRNDGRGGFRAATAESGLEPLTWGYGQWFSFFTAPPAPAVDAQLIASCLLSSNQRPACLAQGPADLRFYHADSVWADFDNDGWVDLLAVDRHEFDSAYGKLRNVLFLNKRHGRFEPIVTEISGIDENGIAAEAVDLDRDGLLDIHVMKDITNTAPGANLKRNVPPSEFTDSVFWNTGQHGGRENHWVAIRLTGLPHGQLIGSRLRMYSRRGTLIGRRDLFPVTSYKTSVELEAHFGLGRHTRPELRIETPAGRTVRVPRLPVDRTVSVNVRTGTLRSSAARRRPSRR